MFSGTNLSLANELVETIRFFSQKGWSPATSTNYSVRSTDPDEIIISRSGVDKSRFGMEDLLLINRSGELLPPFNRPCMKSSAETEIHTAVYEHFPEINCVLHTHSLLGTVLSLMHEKDGQLRFEGLELLKGLEGNTTHEMVEVVPIVPNSQSMSEILKNIEPQFKARVPIHGFLIAGHGLYTWGKDIASAKRHIETFEFLFECMHMMRRM